jgi:hypothetical protein
VIEEVDTELRDWAATIVGESAEVTLSAPANPEKSMVNVYLAAILPAPPLRGEHRAPLQLALRYLVSAWAPEVAEQHRLLGALAVGAMTDSRYEVELESVPADLWQAFGAIPRPSFYLKVPVRQARPEPKVKLVRKPIVIEGTNLTSLFGKVVGPGGVPLASATVEIPTANLATETDYAGRFGFNGVPSDPPKKLVRVKARRHELAVEVSTPSAEPLVIRFDQLED